MIALSPPSSAIASWGLLSSVLRSSRSPSTHSGRAARTRSQSHPSPTRYLVERLRPRDDDKALSEVITYAFHRGKDEGTEKKCGEDRPTARRVTESEKLRRRLGSDGEASNHCAAVPMDEPNISLHPRAEHSGPARTKVKRVQDCTLAKRLFLLPNLFLLTRHLPQSG
ncbi:hypothetical protein L6452_08215 [Arctium lappa]|uniref:Uncharacterized protein n=1 Tax=Arctium lappa TaxID=4217 RepID=A0ACB9DH28_ARCLA|nr:hypothetical protein L6452_08215 [Arctium lappa]